MTQTVTYSRLCQISGFRGKRTEIQGKQGGYTLEGGPRCFGESVPLKYFTQQGKSGRMWPGNQDKEEGLRLLKILRDPMGNAP